MNFGLERGGGAFKVDALSGWDLHDAGPATESKVIVAESNDFHQLALAARRRGNNGGRSFATMAQSTNTAGASSSGPRQHRSRRVAVPKSAYDGSSSDPLPSQVASSDAELRTVMQLSSSESQQQRDRQYHMDSEFLQQHQRAVLESQNDNYAGPRKNEDEESEVQMALERSVEDRQHRPQQELTENEYEDAIMRAMEESNREASISNNALGAEDNFEDDLKIALEKSTLETTNNTNNGPSEEDLMDQALAESRALAEVEKSTPTEEELLEKVLAESLLEEERRKSEIEESKNSTSEDDLLEKALAESILEEERRKKEARRKSSEEDEIFETVQRLSLTQNMEESMTEEQAMMKAIEMSKQFR
mmetsp:Transcript_2043/g.4513  ORF Transcript_2043/g.4513 Transcript_2043/m.4513 type:complete len:363 (-) Transcript_2043:107-1195(-)